MSRAELRPVLLPARAVAPTGWALLPLRAFLGGTFCFAGLQKLANPEFFHASNPISIQAQMAAAVRRSPIHAIVSPLTHVAVALGVVLALAELAIGLGTLLGLWARVAAVGGALVSLALLLTVSFHSSPYYTGSDVVFFFAWMPFILVGSGGVLSVDALATELVRRKASTEPRARPASRAELDRRTFAARGAVAGLGALAGLLLGGVAAAAGRLAGGSMRAAVTPPLGSTGTTAGPTTTAPPTTSPTTSVPGASTTTVPPTTSAPAQPAGTRIGPASAVPVGGAAQFSDPSSGDPSLVVQPKSGTFVAFDAVCPHAGCIVGYDSRSKIFVCPCHGSQFNGRTGAVEVGPATTGLAPITIAEGPDGQLYVS